MVDAYDEEAAKPKHHLCFHVGPQAKKNGLVVDCWAPERKNHDYKELVDSGRFQRLHDLEISAYARLLNMQRYKMVQRPDLFEDHLGEPSFTCPALRDALNAGDLKIARWLQANQAKYAVDAWLSLTIGLCFALRGASFQTKLYLTYFSTKPHG